MKLVTTRFKSGGLHEKHVVGTWNFGTISAFAFRHRDTWIRSRTIINDCTFIYLSHSPRHVSTSSKFPDETSSRACVCVCVWESVYVCECVCECGVCMYVCVCVCVWCVCMYVYVCGMCVCVCVSVWCVCVCESVCECVCGVCVCVYVCVCLAFEQRTSQLTVKKKVNQSHYRPGEAQTVPGN